VRDARGEGDAEEGRDEAGGYGDDAVGDAHGRGAAEQRRRVGRERAVGGEAAEDAGADDEADAASPALIGAPVRQGLEEEPEGEGADDVDDEDREREAARGSGPGEGEGFSKGRPQGSAEGDEADQEGSTVGGAHLFLGAVTGGRDDVSTLPDRHRVEMLSRRQ
jgi:hypothetical protein